MNSSRENRDNELPAEGEFVQAFRDTGTPWPYRSGLHEPIHQATSISFGWEMPSAAVTERAKIEDAANPKSPLDILKNRLQDIFDAIADTIPRIEIEFQDDIKSGNPPSDLTPVSQALVYGIGETLSLLIERDKKDQFRVSVGGLGADHGNSSHVITIPAGSGAEIDEWHVDLIAAKKSKALTSRFAPFADLPATPVTRRELVLAFFRDVVDVLIGPGIRMFLIPSGRSATSRPPAPPASLRRPDPL